MLLPNAALANVDIRKLQDYCLNLFHDEGKHKALLFFSILDMTAEDASVLKEKILEAIKTHPAQLSLKDRYGQRYSVDFIMAWNQNKAIVRTGWIIEHQHNIPRLVTCYPLKEVSS